MKQKNIWISAAIFVAVFFTFMYLREQQNRKIYRIERKIFERKTDSLLKIIDSISKVYDVKNSQYIDANQDVDAIKIRFDSLSETTRIIKAKYYEKNKFSQIDRYVVDSIFNDILSGANIYYR
jgi:tRNA uridine 5-carbamoylmethylation protein Kti12